MLMSLASRLGSRTYRGWEQRGIPASIFSLIDSFWVSATIGVSENCFYGILLNNNTNNQFTFVHYLKQLICARRK